MNDRESEVERLAREVRPWVWPMLCVGLVWLALSGALILVATWSLASWTLRFVR